MDYEMILDEIIKFENLTSQEIQDELVPIIKSYDINFLSKLVNVSKDNIHRICKSLFVNKNQRVSFKLYIKLLALDKAKDKEEKTMKKYIIDDLTMENIATYMDEEVREKVHSKEAPCSNEHFLVAYYEELQAGEFEKQSEFYDLLLNEFNINIEEFQDIERVAYYDGCIISLETLRDLEKEYVVEFCANNGFSGNKIGKHWYTLHLINGTDVEVYTW